MFKGKVCNVYTTRAQIM